MGFAIRQRGRTATAARAEEDRAAGNTAADERPVRRLRETTVPRSLGSPATTACEAVHAYRSVRPGTSRTDSSTAGTPRRRPSRESERARGG